ncbi:hypothetical protein [Curtobacterium sp. MCPF17_052]|uniref:hypothetical protein n=1 Tax=Curtobacterium sp. MCPF17_052 TaxID=2175655 RepID=UPI0024DFA9E5|nr:hypothetical protein [Curtobacterium sp. MCPF17_052]WIB14092.1 hypothetical protein DEJ36_08680 [Curtobacterium sp. MCPF17_052]
MRTGQDIRTDAGSSWFFDAGRIALDFAHTGGFADDPDRRRPPRSPRRAAGHTR